MSKIGSSTIQSGTALAITGLEIGFAERQANKAADREADLKKEMSDLKRQPIINPYSDVTNLSDMVSDLSSMLSNPFDSLGVATGAAEMQAEETDIALANTLDTLRASGASAGGATALARMALESKKGIANDIQRQEVNNNQLRAQGQENLINNKMNEAKRQQGVAFGEAQRLQQADVSGKEFVYGEQETRDMQELNRLQAQITGQQQSQMVARQRQSSAVAAGLTAFGNIDFGSSNKNKSTPVPKTGNPQVGDGGGGGYSRFANE